MEKEIRVRFAPSPTGYLHPGSIRTALYNWLFARHNHGKFLIRIEDTDKSRDVKGAVEESLLILKKLGLNWDGDIILQSEKVDTYRKYADQLLDDGLAYYDGSKRLKFRVPDEGEVAFEDLLHGRTTFSMDKIEDFVILRSNGFPLYNFACVVDDMEMSISHVIRGNEHISNSPRQIMLYKAFGMKEPLFVHLPTILGSDGKKLAKRHGALPLDTYFEMGYIPEAICNYLALLGWSPGDNREVMSLEELVELFDIEGVSRHNAVFDLEKMKWVNSQHISRTADAKLVDMLESYQMGDDRERLLRLVALYKSRAKLLTDFVEWTRYLRGETTYSEFAINTVLNGKDAVPILEAVKEKLGDVSQFGRENIEKSLRSLDKEEFFEPLFSIDELPNREDVMPILEAVRQALDALSQFDHERIADSLGSIDKEKLLGLLSSPGEFQGALNNGEIPEVLRQKLELRKVRLSQEAGVLVSGSDQWQIKDGNRLYRVRKMDSKLYFYGLRFKDIAQTVRVAIVGDTVSPDIFEILALIGKDKALDKIQRCVDFCRNPSRKQWGHYI